jgi:hypothetical protein
MAQRCDVCGKGPQAAESATVRWVVEATGGVGDRTFEFRLSDGMEERRAQEGPTPVIRSGRSGCWSDGSSQRNSLDKSLPKRSL